MGNYTTIGGEFGIDPPLPWALVKAAPGLDLKEMGVPWQYRFRIAEDVVETDEGSLIKKTAVAILPWTDKPYRAGELSGHLQALVDLVGEGREFRGRFRCQTECYDPWCMEIVNSRVVQDGVREVGGRDLARLRDAYAFHRRAREAVGRGPVSPSTAAMYEALEEFLGHWPAPGEIYGG